jgi:hypothetical protein
MPGLKVTRELHAQVSRSLKRMTISATARKHGLSTQTVSRIKRGGSYIGYKRELDADHMPTFFVRDKDPNFLEDIPEKKLTLLQRVLRRSK